MLSKKLAFYLASFVALLIIFGILPAQANENARPRNVNLDLRPTFWGHVVSVRWNNPQESSPKTLYLVELYKDGALFAQRTMESTLFDVDISIYITDDGTYTGRVAIHTVSTDNSQFGTIRPPGPIEPLFSEIPDEAWVAASNKVEFELASFEEGTPEAPRLSRSGLTAETVKQWLTAARQTPGANPAGIQMLEELLIRLTPQRKRTLLLANYPNPFNPETWIPYQLAKPADVRVSIYSSTGRLVRELTLGHQAAGSYESKGRAAYWDGRNTQGERVASGVYFYTLTADNFAATKKMLIRK